MRFGCVLLVMLFSCMAVDLSGQQTPDRLREFQFRAVQLNQSDWIHWGDRPGQYSSWTSHSNRLIPVYSWGLSLDSVQNENSIYRDAEKLKRLYGGLVAETLNDGSNYMDQTDVFFLQKQAWKAGKKNVILVVFDGMDWQTTQAASIYKNKKVLYESGRGKGLGFLDYGVAQNQSDFGFCVTAPHSGDAKFNVDAQVLTELNSERIGGYSMQLGGATPWSKQVDPSYLIGKRKDVPHAYTDSAASATSLNTGIKTFNGSINIDPTGQQVETLAHQMQKAGYAIGVVSSVSISHATPSCVYAHNVSRDDYQDLTRDLLGLPSISHREDPLLGVDVLIGCGWGQNQDDDRANQGVNYVPGNKYLTANDLSKIDVRQGGKYVVAERTPGQSGTTILSEATAEAIRSGKRLFGYFGVAEGEAHLPFQTADGNFDPTPGVKKRATYQSADIFENPTLADMSMAALEVLQENEKGFFLMVEAGDVDWANHNNNIDDSIGAVFSGDDAFQEIVKWVEAESNWNETCLILTADHGHFMVLDDPTVLTGQRKPIDAAAFEQLLAEKREAEAKAAAEKLAAEKLAANQAAVDAGGFYDDFTDKSSDFRKALRGEWTYLENAATCVADPELYKKYNNHGPIIRWPCEFTDGTIEFEFKPQGVQKLVVTLNESGHVFRMVLTDQKTSRIFGWSQPSQDSRPEVLIKQGMPLVSSFDQKWSKGKIVFKNKKATVSIGGYSTRLNHELIARKKSEFTISFASGELALRHVRITPTAKVKVPSPQK